MDNLWAPWRMAFIKPKMPPEPGCIFCTQPAAQRDDEYYILHRGEYCFMILNLYPYNNGHLMVSPYEHVGSISSLNAAILADLMAQVQLALKALRLALNPDGFNMGINEGKVAGAGFADHTHYHIVPRWNGDTNFMPVIADIKVMPDHLKNVYHQLKDALEQVKAEPTIKVELDIFSGRPNPSWQLSSQEIIVLAQYLLDLPIIHTTPGDGGLGYRGFVISNSGSVASIPRQVHIYKGVLTVSDNGQTTFFKDTKGIEAWLHGQAQQHGYGDILKPLAGN